MSHKPIALLASAALASALPASAEAQIFRGRATASSNAAVINEIPRCTQNLGTVTIAETQNTMFRQMELGHSTEMLRYMIRESGCFRLIERGAGMSVVERERGLGAAGRIRTADFVLVAELSNHIEVANSDRGSSLLGTLTSVGARAAVAAMTAGTSEVAGLVSRGVDLLGSGGDDDKPEPSLDQRTLTAIEDLAKDIRKGDQDAQMTFSLSSVPLAEVVSNNRAIANRRDVRTLRIRDNQFGGRVGSGYENTETGQIIALAMVRGYADMVTSLGGMDSRTPEVVIANREALEQAESGRRDEENRAERAALAERDAQRARIQREEEARIAEENRIREEIRREERARIAREMASEAQSEPVAESAPVRVAREEAASPAPAATTTPSRSAFAAAAAQTAPAQTLRIARMVVLRSNPSGEPMKALNAGDLVETTGRKQDSWIEVEIEDGTKGWIQEDRATSAN